MIPELNDDCWFHICKYLRLTDNLRIAQTSQRHSKIISKYYTNKNVTLDKKIWCRSARQKQEHIATFRLYVEPYVNEIHLEGIDRDEPCILDELPLDKITSLRVFNIDRCTFSTMQKYLSRLSGQLKELSVEGYEFYKFLSDFEFPNVTKLLVFDEFEFLYITNEIFPALTNLVLCGAQMDPFHLIEFRNLTTLTIQTKNLTPDELDMIFFSLTLKKLEIRLAPHVTLAGISQCETLEELGFAYLSNYSLDELNELKSLKKLSVTDNILPILQLPNIIPKYLSLYENEIWKLKDLNYATKLKQLHHLQIYASRGCNRRKRGNHNGVLKILKYSHNLRMLELCGSDNYALEMLKEIARVSENIYGERKETLRISCFIKHKYRERRSQRIKHLKSLKECESFKNLSLPNFMKISFQEYKNDICPKIQCDWQQ